MPLPDPSSLFDAERMSAQRTAMPTALSTAELRELGADVLARSVFVARGTNAIFANELQRVVDLIVGGTLSEGQARTVMYEVLDLLGYDVEKGGFPGEEVPPALRGTLQDLRSFRRMDLIIRTQRDLMIGAGEQWRGHQAEMITAYPAWELVRVAEVKVPRDWPSRWTIAGGLLIDADTGEIITQEDFGPSEWEYVRQRARMIALKGSPIWGELGSYENFPDALGVDFPPFAFNSGMGWKPVSAAEVRALKIKGPDNESPEDWFATRPATLTGKLALPAPRMSLGDVDPEIAAAMVRETKAMPVPQRPGMVDYSDLLAAEILKGGGQ